MDTPEIWNNFAISTSVNFDASIRPKALKLVTWLSLSFTIDVVILLIVTALRASLVITLGGQCLYADSSMKNINELLGSYLGAMFIYQLMLFTSCYSVAFLHITLSTYERTQLSIITPTTTQWNRKILLPLFDFHSYG